MACDESVMVLFKLTGETQKDSVEKDLERMIDVAWSKIF